MLYKNNVDERAIDESNATKREKKKGVVKIKCYAQNENVCKFMLMGLRCQ